MEIKAPDVILRNEKRMLQEAVDALLIIIEEKLLFVVDHAVL